MVKVSFHGLMTRNKSVNLVKTIDMDMVYCLRLTGQSSLETGNWTANMGMASVRIMAKLYTKVSFGKGSSYLKMNK